MRISRPFVAAVTVLALAGFGCAGKTPSPPAPSPADRPVPSAAPAPMDAPIVDGPVTDAAPAPESVPPPADDLGTDALTTTVALDDTWKTYVNAALGFEFRWPSKGRYAPDWEVTFVPKTDARMDGGCFLEGASERSASQKRVSVGEIQFCRTSYEEGAAGSRYLTDRYATLKGSQYIIITFTKRAYSASAVGCQGFDLSVSSTACIAFDEKAYLDLLDQSVSTFRYT